MRHDNHEEWTEQCERLATARERGEYDRARRAAATLATIASNPEAASWAAFLAHTIEISRLLRTTNHDVLLRRLAEARAILDRFYADDADPGPAIDFARAEIDWLELYTARLTKSFEHPARIERALDERFAKLLEARDALALTALPTAPAGARGRFGMEMLEACSIAGLIMRVRWLAERSPEFLHSPRRVEAVIKQELVLFAQRYGPLDDVFREFLRTPSNRRRLNEAIVDGEAQWTGLPGAPEVERLFEAAHAAKLTPERFIELRASMLKSFWEAMLRAAPFLLEAHTSRLDQPDVRSRFGIRILGFVAETVYKPLLRTLVEMSAEAFALTPCKDSTTLGGLRAYIKKTWPQHDATRSAVQMVIHDDLIRVRNAGPGHYSDNVLLDGTVILVDKKGVEARLSPDLLKELETSVAHLLLLLFNCWNYNLPPEVRRCASSNMTEDAPPPSLGSSEVDANARTTRG